MTQAAEIYTGLAEVFQEVFPRSKSAPHPEMISEQVPGWDSLGHGSMIVAIEDRFGVEFTPEEYVEFDSVGELVQMIQAKLP